MRTLQCRSRAESFVTGGATGQFNLAVGAIRVERDFVGSLLDCIQGVAEEETLQSLHPKRAATRA